MGAGGEERAARRTGFTDAGTPGHDSGAAPHHGSPPQGTERKREADGDHAGAAELLPEKAVRDVERKAFPCHRGPAWPVRRGGERRGEGDCAGTGCGGRTRSLSPAAQAPDEKGRTAPRHPRDGEDRGPAGSGEDLPEMRGGAAAGGPEVSSGRNPFCPGQGHRHPNLCADVFLSRMQAGSRQGRLQRAEFSRHGSRTPGADSAQHGDRAGGGARHVPEVCERSSPLPAGNGLGAVWTAAVPRVLSQMDPNLFGGLLPPRVCVSAPPAAAEEVPDGGRDANPGAQRAAACGRARFVPLGLPQRRRRPAAGSSLRIHGNKGRI